MKNIYILLMMTLLVYGSHGQPIGSGVFHLNDVNEKATKFGYEKTIAIGSARDFRKMKIYFLCIKPGKKYTVSSKLEKLVIIRSGNLTTGENPSPLSSGSVLVYGSDTRLLLNNGGQEDLELYLFEYQSAFDDTSSDTPLPIIKNWDSIEYKTHDKGGIRNFFDVGTSECRKFEMHVTNLNAGIKSHEPHTHRAGEFVLMVYGNTEMEIDGKVYPGNAGDLYFLESEISHAIKNIGEEQCQYFAFQME